MAFPSGGVDGRSRSGARRPWGGHDELAGSWWVIRLSLPPGGLSIVVEAIKQEQDVLGIAAPGSQRGQRRRPD
jgi:hypothetical protein